MLGTPGQIASLLIFVYLALVSSGGTVPLEALGGFFEFLAASAGLVFWVTIGATVTTWYDRKGLHRASPALREYIDTAVRGYPAPGPGPS